MSEVAKISFLRIYKGCLAENYTKKENKFPFNHSLHLLSLIAPAINTHPASLTQQHSLIASPSPHQPDKSSRVGLTGGRCSRLLIIFLTLWFLIFD